ncbi:unnamed protein product [Acanthoscelides obtectus]|uniref:Uncharacterized protein n=1 Tax=Acanthoscelides obtectus TaxID=200917 RepID=A0A9P0QG96_ACAOB|nr:unnamed protein product [Acanthoscelides obtectus]CAK1682727.1 hypothetical protein AOBTE_LOCUS33831 [Acanthoscelides obtectus]
MRMNVETMH